MRLKRELSKTALAHLVGVPASTITRIESGIVDPTYSMLQKIASGAGFILSGTLADVGSDSPYVAVLERVQNASSVEKRRLVKKLAQTATLAPATKRPGVSIFALDRSIGDFIRFLEERGANPVVSSLEAEAVAVAVAVAVAEDMTSTRSFTPVVYVDRPEDLDDLPATSHEASCRSSPPVPP